MQIQQVNRVDAEKVYVLVKNVDASSITTGMGVCLLTTGASVDGIQSVRYVTGLGNPQGFIGVAVQDIANNSYGLSQVWGYCASVQISNTTISATVNAGDLLIPSTVNGTFFTGVLHQNLSTVLYKYIWVASANAQGVSTSPAWATGIIRAL